MKIGVTGWTRGRAARPHGRQVPEATGAVVVRDDLADGPLDRSNTILTHR